MPELNAIGIVASDMAHSIRFYQAVGVRCPGHAGKKGTSTRRCRTACRLMLDTEETRPQLPPRLDTRDGESGSGFALECESPAEVDEIYARVTAAGFHGEKEPWDAFWGQR
jgi:catechol 2,3-dioxygenase-like lactoylglutathione lyase family enzyme